MEKISFFESTKKYLIERANQQKADIEDDEMSMSDIVLANIDEYTLKEVTTIVNGISEMAQKVSDGIITFEQFENHYSSNFFKVFGFEDILNYVKNNEKKHINIAEQVREYFLTYSKIPIHLTGMIFRKEDVERAKMEYNQMKKIALADTYNYELRKNAIEAEYRYYQVKELYSPYRLALNNPENSQAIESRRLEEIEKLDAEFTQIKTTTR